MIPTILDLESQRRLYAVGVTPLDLVDCIAARRDRADAAVFIAPVGVAVLREAAALLRCAPASNSQVFRYPRDHSS